MELTLAFLLAGDMVLMLGIDVKLILGLFLSCAAGWYDCWSKMQRLKHGMDDLTMLTVHIVIEGTPHVGNVNWS